MASNPFSKELASSDAHATDDMAQVRREFRTLKALSERLSGIPYCDQVSMGMSEDWPVAVEEGTTIVRIGTAIFGKRNQTR